MTLSLLNYYSTKNNYEKWNNLYFEWGENDSGFLSFYFKILVTEADINFIFRKIIVRAVSPCIRHVFIRGNFVNQKEYNPIYVIHYCLSKKWMY